MLVPLNGIGFANVAIHRNALTAVYRWERCLVPQSKQGRSQSAGRNRKQNNVILYESKLERQTDLQVLQLESPHPAIIKLLCHQEDVSLEDTHTLLSIQA